MPLYTSSKNINRQKQEYLNREYTFKPLYNYNDEEESMSDRVSML
jgi:hypothetical protein